MSGEDQSHPEEEQNHPIEGLMKTAMKNIQEMANVQTIVGDPIETPDGSVILTVSKVGFGFAAGGSEFQAHQASQEGEDEAGVLPFGGGSGGGVSITPIAFLIVSESDIQTIHLDNTTHLYEKLLNLAPQAIEKIQKMAGGRDKDKEKDKESEEHESSHKSRVRH